MILGVILDEKLPKNLEVWKIMLTFANALQYMPTTL